MAQTITTKAQATRAANKVGDLLYSAVQSGLIDWAEADRLGEDAIARVFDRGESPSDAVAAVLSGKEAR